jgi:hypothetical protein
MADACLSRADEALARAGLAESALAGIARWVVTRQS